MGLVKTVEQSWPLLGWNADSMIPDAQTHNSVITTRQVDLDGAAVGAEFDGIVEEVYEDLLDPQSIDEGHRVSTDTHRQLVVGGIHMHQRQHLVHQSDQVSRSAFEHQAVGLKP